MVTIDQYNSKVRPSPLAGVLRFVQSVRLGDVVRAPIYLFRRTDAENLAKRLRDADRVSASAGMPTAPLKVEPARLDAAAIKERLSSADAPLSASTDNIGARTTQAYARLDRIEYDLEAMRDEIAPYIGDLATSHASTSAKQTQR